MWTWERSTKVRKNFAAIPTSHCLKKKHFANLMLDCRMPRRFQGSVPENVVNRVQLSRPLRIQPFLQQEQWTHRSMKEITEKIVESEIFNRMINTKHRLLRNGRQWEQIIKIYCCHAVDQDFLLLFNFRERSLLLPIYNSRAANSKQVMLMDAWA